MCECACIIVSANIWEEYIGIGADTGMEDPSYYSCQIIHNYQKIVVCGELCSQYTAWMFVSLRVAMVQSVHS